MLSEMSSSPAQLIWATLPVNTSHFFSSVKIVRVYDHANSVDFFFYALTVVQKISLQTPDSILADEDTKLVQHELIFESFMTQSEHVKEPQAGCCVWEGRTVLLYVIEKQKGLAAFSNAVLPRRVCEKSR